MISFTMTISHQKIHCFFIIQVMVCLMVLGNIILHHLTLIRIDLAKGGISFDELEYWIESCKSSRILTILDCCFSGAAGLEGLKDDDTSLAKKACIHWPNAAAKSTELSKTLNLLTPIKFAMNYER